MNMYEKPDQGPKILIVDMGGQYTLRIATRLRELGIRSAVLVPAKVSDWLKSHTPLGIILSGGDRSVNDENAITIPPVIFSLCVPILGLCYGMQALAKHLNGKVESVETLKEYGGGVRIHVDTTDPLFEGLDKTQEVLASHGDTVTELGCGCRQIATSLKTRGIAGFINTQAKVWGVQFHPECIETPNGARMLANFIFGICKCQKDWFPDVITNTLRHELKDSIGNNRAIIGYSGGVDSSTYAALASEVLKDNLLGVIIDGGQFEEGEIDEILENAKCVNLSIVVIDARERLQKALAGIIDDQEKRKAFKGVYLAILEEEAQKFGAKFLLQGSLATDFIESGHTGGVVIKTHHNIGLETKLTQVHLLRDLFKYEVRALAEELKLPSRICRRMPSPGPGLIIRILNAPSTTEWLKVVAWAQARTRSILAENGELECIDQFGVHLICVPTTGVKGDARSREFAVVVRTITSTDYMTAQGYHLPPSTIRNLEDTLTRHPRINRVWFDTTPKPPATIELQ